MIRARRSGVIAQKVGMTQIFDDSGKALAVTLLKVDENIVVDNKTQEKHGYDAVVVGFGVKKASRCNKSEIGIATKNGCPNSRIIREFRVSQDALLKIGSKFSIEHFVLEQRIDVRGISTGKGFAGAMKRWNFRGLEASHGVSVTHRSHGSTGQRQDPGRVFKGKKMAGHLGAEIVSLQNLRVVLIDAEMGVIGVNGSIPGRRGSYVTLTDSIKLSLPSGVVFPAAIINEEKVVEVENE